MRYVKPGPGCPPCEGCDGWKDNNGDGRTCDMICETYAEYYGIPIWDMWDSYEN